MLASANRRRIFRGGVQVGESATYFSRPTPAALRFANGAAPVSPHPYHVDDHNKPYRKPDHAPSKGHNQLER
jgi:hypothetical protein